MRRFIAWIQGWTATFDIRFNNPELYKTLTQPFDINDYEEAGPP